MTRLSSGDTAPAFTLLDQHGDEQSLSDWRGRPVVLFFYPKASTPGCTNQACGLRDVSDEIEAVEKAVIVGISPDSPKRQENFDKKHELGFSLLSDPDHVVAESYGIWGEKKLYGKVYMGVIRSAFVIGGDGKLVAVHSPISPKATPAAALDGLGLIAGG